MSFAAERVQRFDTLPFLRQVHERPGVPAVCPRSSGGASKLESKNETPRCDKLDGWGEPELSGSHWGMDQESNSAALTSEAAMRRRSKSAWARTARLSDSLAFRRTAAVPYARTLARLTNSEI